VKRVPSGALALLLPTPAQTDFLRACLLTGDRARAAWEQWRQAVGDPRRGAADPFSGSPSLLPLLHHATQGGGIDADPALRAVLAASALVESRRAAAYRRICARALDALAAAGIASLVLKGSALADSVYPEPSLRHSHDVDLLVHRDDLARAAAALGAADFASHRASIEQRADGIVMGDASGLPVVLHATLLRMPYHAPALEGIWSRAVPRQIAGCAAQALSAADQLVQICGQAAGPGRDTLRWATDAWFLLQRTPDLDWTIALDFADDARLALICSVLLGYLAHELRAPVPAAALDRLSTAAASADRAERDVALFAVREGRRGTLRGLLRAARGQRDRIDLVRWMLLPSASGLRGTPLPHPRLWPAYYAVRPLSYVVRRLMRFAPR
jgi:hypothetical protein